MIVRPRRRTTFDPSFCFNDFSEFLTFIVLPFFALSNDLGQPFFGVEYYRQVRGEALTEGRGDDLFPVGEE